MTQDPIIADVDGIGELEFPAGTDPAVIQATVKRVIAERSQPQATQKTWSDRLGLNAPTASPMVGFLKGSGASAVDILDGGKAGGASTLFHGGDLIRRGLGMERVIERPEVRASMTAPASMGGQIGFMGEQVAEFAVPLTRLSGAMKGAGLMKRMAVDAGATAGVAGIQTGGDSGAMTVGAALGGALPVVGAVGGAAAGAVRRAAAGASEGGVGGAVAGAVRRVVPSDTRTMLVQGLKPRATKTGFEGSLGKAVPEIKAAEAALGKPIENIDDLLKAAKLAKQAVRKQYDEMAGPMREMGATVDLTDVADSMARSLPKKTRLEDPNKAAAILERAEQYRGRFSLEDAEQLLRETNAELDSFYNKYPMAQRRAVDADPEAAQLVAQAKALRDAIYKTLDDPGQGTAARELNRRYGAILDLEDAAFRRANVAKRQQPESLSEQIGAVRAAADTARGAWKLSQGNIGGAADIAAAHAGRSASKFIKEQQTTDALIKRAFASYRGGPNPAVVMPVRRPVRGLLERGAIPIEAGPDSSYVKGVPARPAVSERKALPPAREVREAGPAPDSSFVRGVPAKYGEKWTPPPTAPVAPAPVAPKPKPERVAKPAAQPTPQLPPPLPAASYTAPKAKAPKKVAAEVKAQTTGVTPATVTPKPATTPTVTPAKASTIVERELDRVVDLSGAKSATEIQSRVLKALADEIEPSRAASGVGPIELRPISNKRVHGRAIYDGDKHIGHLSDDYWLSLFAKGKDHSVQLPHDSKGTTKSVENQLRLAISKEVGASAGAGVIRVQIPGDGTFTIQRNPAAIAETIARIKKAGPSVWGPAPKPDLNRSLKKGPGK